MKAVPIITNVVSWNPNHGEVTSIQDTLFNATFSYIVAVSFIDGEEAVENHRPVTSN
jgi:hypothetical protein